MHLISLVMTIVVFGMWAFSMFRLIFALCARAVARTGKDWPGPVDTLQEWRNWLRDPAFKQERRQIYAMTAAVLLLSYMFSLSLSGPV